MSKIDKPSVDDIVKVVFLDHAQDLGKPLVCTVYGVVEYIDKTSMNILTWHPTNKEDQSEGVNQTVYTIIRSCVRRLRVLI